MVVGGGGSIRLRKHTDMPNHRGGRTDIMVIKHVLLLGTAFGILLLLLLLRKPGILPVLGIKRGKVRLPVIGSANIAAPLRILSPAAALTAAACIKDIARIIQQARVVDLLLADELVGVLGVPGNGICRRFGAADGVLLEEDHAAGGRIDATRLIIVGRRAVSVVDVGVIEPFEAGAFGLGHLLTPRCWTGGCDRGA